LNNPRLVIYSVPCCCTLPSHALQEYISSCWRLLAHHRTQHTGESPTEPRWAQARALEQPASAERTARRQAREWKWRQSRDALETHSVTKHVTRRNAYLCPFHKSNFCINIHKNSPAESTDNTVNLELGNKRKNVFPRDTQRVSLTLTGVFQILRGLVAWPTAFCHPGACHTELHCSHCSNPISQETKLKTKSGACTSEQVQLTRWKKKKWKTGKYVNTEIL